MNVGAAPAVPKAVGVYLAAVQFVFALGWVVYVAYLPQLAQQVGLERRWVPWILALDQVVFIVCDLVVGLWSDRAARVVSRISRGVLVATAISVAAFVLMPTAASGGSAALFLGLTLVWAVTSSALRAPPLTLLGRYVARPSQPAFVALMALGLGLCNAAAPYLALQMKAVDPWWPFLLSGLLLALVTLGMVWAERAMAAQGVAVAAAQRLPTLPTVGPAARVYLLGCLLAAAAFQAHVFLMSAPLYLRHVPAAELTAWLPVFWVGFNLGLWPAGRWTKAFGAPQALAVGSAVAALAMAGAHLAPGPVLLALAQLVAGAAWAAVVCGAFSAALAFGHTGREGLFNGALQALLASAALSRLLVVALLAPAPAVVLSWAGAPAVGFAATALLLAWGFKRVAGWPRPA